MELIVSPWHPVLWIISSVFIISSLLIGIQLEKVVKEYREERAKLSRILSRRRRG